MRAGLVVIANYSGYLPNGLRVPPGGQRPPEGAAVWGRSPDARPDFATGLVTLRYVPERRTFDILWEDSSTQISGVPTISAGSNLVYGTGAEEDSGMLYLYGLLLEDDVRGPGGTRVLRTELGSAPFRTPVVDADGNTIFPVEDYQLQPGELFDAGNNLLVNSDDSIVFSGGRALVRVRTP